MTTTADPAADLTVRLDDLTDERALTSAPRKPATRLPERRRRSGWVSWLTVLVAAGAIAAIAWTQIDSRLAARDRLPLNDVVLTIAPIPIGPTVDGTVIEMVVQTQQRIEIGDVIGTVQPAPGSAAGTDPVAVTAAIDGTVIELVSAGSTVTSSEALVVLYRPEDSVLRVAVDFDTLADVTIGMDAELSYGGIDPVRATVERVESLPSGDPEAPATGAVVVLRPERPEALRSVLPGLTFDGFIDLTSGPEDGLPAVASFGN